MNYRTIDIHEVYKLLIGPCGLKLPRDVSFAWFFFLKTSLESQSRDVKLACGHILSVVNLSFYIWFVS